MDELEKTYLRGIEGAIEHFGKIQRNFVLDKAGVRAIVNFIGQFEGRQPFFDLDDPVVVKGKAAVGKVIDELSRQLSSLQNLQAPAKWLDFHETLTRSIDIQLEGYKEMVRVFDTGNLKYVSVGQELVNKGMHILQMGEKE